jgi:hypothetical protein
MVYCYGKITNPSGVDHLTEAEPSGILVETERI